MASLAIARRTHHLCNTIVDAVVLIWIRLLVEFFSSIHAANRWCWDSHGHGRWDDAVPDVQPCFRWTSHMDEQVPLSPLAGASAIGKPPE
jgi:hypothetical protein